MTATGRRERGGVLVEVAPLIYEGHAVKEIAYRMGVTSSTARAYVQLFLRHKGVNSRVEVMAARIKELEAQVGGN